MNELLGLLTAHFVGDFLCQSDWMATNKSKRWDALALHVGVYTAVIGAAFVLMTLDGPRMAQPLAWFVALTFFSHFVTDAITSRLTSRLWFFKREDGIWAQAEYAHPKHGRTLVNPWTPIEGEVRHWFFVVIGADQLIHAFTLAATWQLVR